MEHTIVKTDIDKLYSKDPFLGPFKLSWNIFSLVRNCVVRKPCLISSKQILLSKVERSYETNYMGYIDPCGWNYYKFRNCVAKQNASGQGVSKFLRRVIKNLKIKNSRANGKRERMLRIKVISLKTWIVLTQQTYCDTCEHFESGTHFCFKCFRSRL